LSKQRWERDTNFPDLLFCTDPVEASRRERAFAEWLKAHPESDISNFDQLEEEDVRKGFDKWRDLKVHEIKEWAYKVVAVIEPK